MNYGGGYPYTADQRCVWLVGRRPVCGRRLSLLLLLQKYVFIVALSHKLLQDHCTKM